MMAAPNRLRSSWHSFNALIARRQGGYVGAPDLSGPVEAAARSNYQANKPKGAQNHPE